MALPAQPGLLEARPQRRRSSAVRCAVDGVHTKRLLRGVLGEALDAQNRKRVALAEQLEKATLTDAEGVKSRTSGSGSVCVDKIQRPDLDCINDVRSEK